MKGIRSLVVAVALIGVVAMPASAQGDKDCADFTTQARAQAELRSDPADPFGLDGPAGPATGGTLSGVACEDYEYGDAGSLSNNATDHNPVGTGAGGEKSGEMPEELPDTGAGGLAPGTWWQWVVFGWTSVSAATALVLARTLRGVAMEWCR